MIRPTRRLPLRVALVSEHASPLALLGGADAGGQNVHVAALAQHLAARGVDVEVLTRRNDPLLPTEMLLAPRFRLVHVDAGPAEHVPKDALLPYMDKFADVLHRRWRQTPPDVVHAHFWMSGVASQRAARPLGIPLVQTFHALGVVKRREQGSKDTSPPQRLELERRLVRDADCILATCSDEVFELVRLGADANRVAVVPCGVDIELFTPEGDREDHRPGFRHRLVVVSRMVERKGIGNVIEALAGLPGVELVVAGGPARDDLGRDPEGRRLRQLAVRCGVADRVDLRGQVDRSALPSLFRSADAVVCVPWYEPFGIVPLEAMACGRPVVASAVGGLVDSIVHGVTGIHVPPRDPSTLATALAELLADAERRAAMGRAGRQRAIKRFCWENIAGATHARYRELIYGSALAAGSGS